MEVKAWLEACENSRARWGVALRQGLSDSSVFRTGLSRPLCQCEAFKWWPHDKYPPRRPRAPPSGSAVNHSCSQCQVLNARGLWSVERGYDRPSGVERGGAGGGGASAPGPVPVVGARAKLDFFFFF